MRGWRDVMAEMKFETAFKADLSFTEESRPNLQARTALNTAVIGCLSTKHQLIATIIISDFAQNCPRVIGK